MILSQFMQVTGASERSATKVSFALFLSFVFRFPHDYFDFPTVGASSFLPHRFPVLEALLVFETWDTKIDFAVGTAAEEGEVAMSSFLQGCVLRLTSPVETVSKSEKEQ